jgi:putative two-component system response regulator
MGTSMSEFGGKSNMTSLLVVEDDPAMQLALREVLEREGYHVDTASNGKSALAIMEAHCPDLILSDTFMPGMNGFELLETVRSIPSGENLPFIFLTAANSHESKSISNALGADDYITKPITSRELLNTIQACLGRANELRTLQKMPEDNKTTLLVVEDDLAMLVALRDILESAGYRVYTATHGASALEVFQEQRPALILSDISMPVMDGVELFEKIRARPGGTAIPFIFLTARGTREDIFAGMSLGADDYITKPVTSQELLSAVNARLKRTDEIMLVHLKAAYKASLLALSNAIETRDQYTHDHVLRIAAYAQALAKELCWDEAACEILEFGAILHDIGKLDVPVSILLKPGPLTPGEWEQMRRHPVIGAHMLEGIDYLAPAIPIVLYHHENWDGSGYPEGLEGSNIPLGARLLSVVDSFDAMTTSRPYRKAVSAQAAFDEIIGLAGIKYDPTITQAFTRCWQRNEIQAIMTKTTAPNLEAAAATILGASELNQAYSKKSE